MLEKSYLHQNGVELNFLFIGMASGHAISLRINPRIREDSKGVVGLWQLYCKVAAAILYVNLIVLQVETFIAQFQFKYNVFNITTFYSIAKHNFLHVAKPLQTVLKFRLCQGQAFQYVFQPMSIPRKQKFSWGRKIPDLYPIYPKQTIYCKWNFRNQPKKPRAGPTPSVIMIEIVV